MKIQGLVMAICSALAPCLYAESFTTNIVDGIETNAGPQLTVGATGPFNFLLVTNSGKLTNGITVVGDAAGADNNSAVVTGSNSVWNTGGSFLLGNTGALNRVSVLNGARLRAVAITVGAASSSNQLNVRDAFVTDGYPEGGNMTIGAQDNANFNVVTLDGQGARGTNNRTFVGLRGASNSLIVLNGAEFKVGGAPLSIDPEFTVGRREFSHGNSVEISGAGSKLIVICPFTVGDFGSGNRLLVDGAQLQTVITRIGSRSHNNAALIRGVGAVWTNTFFELGLSGVSNSLTITDGAHVLCGSFSSGFQSGGGRNKIEISRPGSLLRAALTVGRLGTQDVLMVTDGGRVVGNSDVLGFLGSDNFALVSGAGSVWSNVTLVVGDSGARNSLHIGDGASVQTGELTIGRLGNATQNTIELTGDGTRLSVATNLTIGGVGDSNRFIVTGGARAEARNIHLAAGSVGAASSSDLNRLSIIGTNSFVMVESNVVVGFEGSSNRLEVLDGGQIHSGGRGVIGDDPGLRNSAIVSGHRSAWLMTNELVIGRWAQGSSLVISNGAFVRSQSGHIGLLGGLFGEGSRCPYRLSGSDVRVTGHNSVWAIADSLVVGNSAILNSLLITNGGRVSARDVIVGATDGGFSDPDCGGVGGGGGRPPFLNEVDIAGGNLDLDMNAVNTCEVRYGTLRVRSGAVNVGKLLMTNEWSRLELLGGSLTCSEALADNRLPLTIGDGLHNASFDSGDIAAPRGIIVREHATLRSGGRINANVTNSGTVVPVLLGTIASSNFVQQPAGNLLINISLQRADSLIVSNVAVLNGKLLLRRTGASPSNVVAIITAAAVTGTFSNATNGARLKTTDNLGSFVVEYTPTSVTLRDYQSTDLDGDGIEDAWATQHFGHSPLTPAEKSADADGDGAGNHDEFVAGTDPGNSTSVLRVSISYTNGAASLVFPSQEGKRYRIVWSPVLAEWSSGQAQWFEILEPTFSFPEPGLCRWTDDGLGTGGLGGTTRFFRVVTEFE